VDTLLRVGLSNAVAACALAMVAGAVGYFCRRPAVRHALWLLVLLKLVTPPLVDVPIWHPADPAPAEEAPAAPAEEPVVLVPEPDPPPAEVAVVEVVESPEDPAAAPPEEAARPADVPPPESRPEPPRPLAFAWQPLALAGWLGGSLVWLALAALRAGRFTRLLRYAAPAPVALQREADRLAARLGLARSPIVRLLPGRWSPMLWAPGWAASLLLPAELLGRLDPEARRTLLAHELAHLRRCDHWVRLFEMLVTALFWWHPVVWWARRELREAEEQCCDAWVLWALPQSAKTYALALVETVDFLSEAPPALPALASGMGHVHDLRRRVTMIMQGTTPRALTWRGLLGLLGLGAFLLPVMPSWAQEEQPGAPIRARVVVDDDQKKAQADLERLLADLKKKQAELMQLEAQVKDAQKRAAVAAGAMKEGEKRIIVIEVVDGESRQTIKLPPGSRIISSEPVPQFQKQPYVADVERARSAAEAKLKELRAQAEKQPRGLIIEIISDGKKQVIELPPGSRVIGGGEDAVRWRIARPVEVMPRAGQALQPPAAGQPLPALPRDVKGIILRADDPRMSDTEKKIADLEKRLEELMRAVKELRGELHKGKSALPQYQPNSLPLQPGSVSPFLPAQPQGERKE
jgi:beta-lactamase regulating signal transducer with metallopeptidase domain